MNTEKEKLEAFERLLGIMDELREKCPWDRKQTLESLRNLTIEETYELADAISEENYEDIKKELGDLMLHIVFYAKIGSESKLFDMADILNAINEKLVFRHPHVFGDVKVDNAGEVIENWEQIKRKEGHKSVLGGVPTSLPAMIKANRVQEKVRAVGFDWDEPHQIWDKVIEEMEEVKEAAAENDPGKTEEEFGDLLFSVINAARLYDVDPETALEKTNRKFIKRFRFLEKQTLEKGRDLRDMTLDEMNVIWEEAKTFDGKN
ncbi:MAG TPA: nucleoside triphosphate pyrophosphohydrolase [Bacteroidales bacterium]|nr:nucleoside triphosphate pyrophosphohydrolase [Bacteroidales bacterium]